MMPSKYLAITLIIGWFLGAASGLMIEHADFGLHHHGRMRERFAKELKLTPDQKKRFDAIIDNTHHQMDQLDASTRAQMDAIQNDTRAQILQLLTPEQQVTFDRLDAKLRAHFNKRMDRLHPPPPPPPPNQN